MPPGEHRVERAVLISGQSLAPTMTGDYNRASVVPGPPRSFVHRPDHLYDVRDRR
jgi:hypothetical protein